MCFLANVEDWLTGSAPTQDEGVDAVCANREDDHGDVATCNTERRACDEKADDCDNLGDGDMPCALVELSGRPGDSDSNDTGKEVGRAGKDKGDGGVEAEGLDNSGEEVLKPVSRKTRRLLVNVYIYVFWLKSTYCICAMAAKIQTRGSLAACRKPAQTLVFSLLPTVSRAMRLTARSRSSWVSHLVL